MTFSSQLIKYHITQDGICSYCGCEADIVEAPDGELLFADDCFCCDEYNSDVRLEDLYED